MNKTDPVYQELRVIASIVLRISRTTKCRVKFRKSLNELGYRKSRNGVSDGAFVNKATGFVIKFPNICDDFCAPTRAIPTVSVDLRDMDEFINLSHGRYCKLMMVQPCADISPKAIRRAMRAVRNSENEDREFGSDTHDGNVGLYKGMPVVFDW